MPWWLRALPGAERAGAVRPAWAAFVEAVLAEAPVSAPAPMGELPRTTGFLTICLPFAESAVERLPGAVAGVDLGAVRARFVERLAGALVRRAARTLVLELNVARVTGRLSGDSPATRFRHFLALTAGRPGLTALLTEYPVLARSLGQCCLNAADALTELLERFAADRARIVAELLDGIDPGPLAAVDGTGDAHGQGRAVSVLRFADGRRVVYRPRPPAVHRHFNGLVHWFNAQPGAPTLPVLALLDRGGYGWLQHVARNECLTEDQLELFYRRLGASLALLYALDGTDLHYENLIARADEPLLIDVETLFHPLLGAHRIEDPAALALRASVQRTGLLPYWLMGDDTALDLSGLGGDPGAVLPTAQVAWADAGTDRMRLVRRAGVPVAAAANRPGLAGGPAEPAEYAEALLLGFRAGYLAIAAGRGELLSPQGPLSRFARDEIRVLLRPTRTYTALLAEATHPDVLRDGDAKAALLGLLGTEEQAGPTLPGLLEHELAHLWEDDIPLFTTRPDSVVLWSGDTPVHGVLARSGLERAADRIRAMDAADCRSQEWVIRAALAGRSSAPVHEPPEPVRAPAVPVRVPVAPVAPAAPAASARTPDPDPERLLGAARRLGDRLLETAHRADGRLNWLGLEAVADRYWQLRPCGGDLANGFPGVALFLAQLAELTGEDRYAESARQALRPLPVLLERLAARPADLPAVGPGALSGLGGIAYAATLAAELLDDDALAACGEQAAALTELAATADGAEAASGVADGLAGGLAALLAVHRMTGSAVARRGATSCAALLAERPLPSEPGFRQGAAGVGWALLGYADAGGGARYRHLGLAALQAAAARAADQASGPAAQPARVVKRPSAAVAAASVERFAVADSWCRGLSGIALAVAGRPAAMADPTLAGVVARAVRGLDGRPPAADHSLCHGETGRLQFLALARLDTPAARAVPARRCALLLDALGREGPRCGVPGRLEVPGLLTGLAGIGHGLLHLAFPDRVTSPLVPLAHNLPAANTPSGP